MELIDTHSHIYDKNDFGEDMEAVIERVKEENITHVVLPNIDMQSKADVLALEAREPSRFHALMGLHPENVTTDYRIELENIMQSFDEHKYYGIGEIGMDLYWDQSMKKEQEEVFAVQVDYATQKNLPIIIHCRNAFRETIDILKKFDKKKVRGIFHSFTGTLEEADIIRSCGNFRYGINGIITFKKSTDLQTVVKEMPLCDLVLETDSPYLTPVPFRGKRNESSYIKYVAQKIAEVKGMGIEEVARETTKTAKEIFNLNS